MRLAADAAHEFGGIALDRGKPLSFTLDGRKIEAFAGDTVLTALLAAGVTTYGRLGESPIGLLPGYAPLVANEDGVALPMERLPATAGAVLHSVGRRARWQSRRASTLGHILSAHAVPATSAAEVETTLTADVLVVGGGVAGLSAAEAAAEAGKTVILVERRPWLGGDARYFGPVGEEENPTTLTASLIATIEASVAVRTLTNAEVLRFVDGAALVQQIEISDIPRARTVAIRATDIVLATGAAQRLPVFAGNRLPGVVGTVAAYHLAKRYGVVLGATQLVATQSNYAYRLAMRLKDAGAIVPRIIDTRIGPQSRFIDFAKASGLTLGSGQSPIRVSVAPRRNLRVDFANEGSAGTAITLEADALVVSGGFQPDITLWMLAGGRVRWRDHKLQATGNLDHVRLAGAAAGLRTLRACASSGRAAIAAILGQPAPEVEDVEIAATFETPDAPTPITPVIGSGMAFLDTGASLITRPLTGRLTAGLELSVGDVAAAVDLRLFDSSDAGAVAEERGAPGTPLTASGWAPPPKPADEAPAYLAGRFGPEPGRVHLMVDGKRKFETGALVYSNAGVRQPGTAIGVIVADADPGGIALVSAAALAENDRYIVETLAGPSPARVRRPTTPAAL